MKKLLSGSVAAATLALLSNGCASTPEPTTALSQAQSEVSVAEATGAQEVPEASLHLKMAKDGVAQAQRLMQEQKYSEASEVLKRAQLDAELATSLAHEEEAKAKAQEQVERVKSLEQTNTQKAAPGVPG